jgi:hypothetical protein
MSIVDMALTLAKQEGNSVLIQKFKEEEAVQK